MKTPRVKPPGVEEWARKVVEMHLGVPVVVHDDGSAPSMYDLRVGPYAAPEVAIEVAGAVDPLQTETWNMGPGKGPIQLSLSGDWIVVVEAGAKMKTLKNSLEGLLQQMEALQVSEADLHFGPHTVPDKLANQMEAVGLVSANRYRVSGSGKVHMTMPGAGGVVDDTGSSLPEWVSTFLADPVRADAVSKLAKSGAPRAEAFIAAESGTPWSVMSYLSGSVSQLPRAAPVLPTGITGVWVGPTLCYHGVYWDGAVWHGVTLPTAGRPQRPSGRTR